MHSCVLINPVSFELKKIRIAFISGVRLAIISFVVRAPLKKLLQLLHSAVHTMAQSIFTTPIATTKLCSDFSFSSDFRFLASSPLRKRVALPVRIGGVCKKSVSVTMAALPGGLFPSAADAAVSVAAVLVAAGGPVLAYREINGNNMKYSKFASSEGKKNAALMIPSKTGMFFLYFPAAVIASVILAGRVELLPLASVLESSFGASGAASFFKDVVVADSDDRLFLLAAALSLHFIKRVLEVLFVHKYSGSITVGETAFIGTSYTGLVSLLLYAQMLSTGVDAPFPNLKLLGVVVFLIGVAGNAYHHWMLSHLCKDRNKKYVVPHGGLFEFLVCPHYVFEMIDFVGIALISQTLFGWSLAWFVLCYLTGRAITTKEWYMKKVEGFPEDRKVLIPGIF